ncbi:MAG TPA: hypothetical protein VJV22_07685 [Acidobacteriaceae bacterium]|nr:hypothetical protein [Acidobacteriaceae bacterium]
MHGEAGRGLLQREREDRIQVGADSQVNLIWDPFGSNFACLTPKLSAQAAQPATREIDEKLEKVVAQNDDSQISSSRQEITITRSAANSSPEAVARKRAG